MSSIALSRSCSLVTVIFVHAKAIYREHAIRYFFALDKAIPRDRPAHNGSDEESDCWAWPTFMGAVLLEVNRSLSKAFDVADIVAKHRDLLEGCDECEKQLELWGATFRARDRRTCIPLFYGNRQPGNSAAAELAFLRSPVAVEAQGTASMDLTAIPNPTYSAQCE